MAITGTTFDRMRVTPKMDALLYDYLNNNMHVGIVKNGDDLKVTGSGLTATVGKGAAVIYGRLITNDAPTQITIPANTKGFICIVIDLTKVNTSSGTPGQDDYTAVNNQVALRAITAASVANLTQEVLTEGGNIYQMPIASYTASGSSLTLKGILFNEVLLAPLTGFKNYNTSDGNKVRVRKVGRNCYLTGTVSPIATLKAPATWRPVQPVPKGWCPLFDAKEICQGSGQNRYLLKVMTDGRVECARYGVTTEVDVVTNAWLNMWASWESEY